MTACRGCGGRELRSFLDLGAMPLSDRLRHEEDLAGPEACYPLEIAFCPSCTLVQILEGVDPEELFCREYPYYSSFSDSLLAHSRANAERLVTERGLGPDSLVVELACNDGYLLQWFEQYRVPVLGVDPAEGPVEAARAKGIPIVHGFFGRELAAELARHGKRADVVIANNVLGHVSDLEGFVAGIATLLADDGTTSIEAPYVRDLIEECEFDTIYHEHLTYFSVTAAEHLFARHGLYLNRVTWLPLQGGTIRYEASPTPNPDGSVQRMLDEEAASGVTGFEFYRSFAQRVEALCSRVRDLVNRLRDRGHTVAAYGAAAKGAILLNAAGLDEELIDFVVDRNAHKHGKYMPGVPIPILPVEALLERQPDYTLILAWNLQEEIVDQQREYLTRGGHFAVPVPEPRVLTDARVYSD